MNNEMHDLPSKRTYQSLTTQVHLLVYHAQYFMSITALLT